MTKKGSIRKLQIVDEASRLISSQGYDGMTMKKLASACGISEPALYRYFDSKDEIYNSVLESIATRLDNEKLFMKLEKEEDVHTILFALAQHIIKFYSKNSDLYRLLLFSALNGHNKAKQVYSVIRGSYVNFLINQFDRLYEAGIIIEKNNEITARCFTGMVFDCSLSTILWKGMQGKSYKPADIIANNVPIYVRGLKSKED